MCVCARWSYNITHAHALTPGFFFLVLFIYRCVAPCVVGCVVVCVVVCVALCLETSIYKGFRCVVGCVVSCAVSCAAKCVVLRSKAQKAAQRQRRRVAAAVSAAAAVGGGGQRWAADSSYRKSQKGWAAVGSGGQQQPKSGGRKRGGGSCPLRRGEQGAPHGGLPARGLGPGCSPRGCRLCACVPGVPVSPPCVQPARARAEGCWGLPSPPGGVVVVFRFLVVLPFSAFSRRNAPGGRRQIPNQP